MRLFHLHNLPGQLSRTTYLVVFLFALLAISLFSSSSSGVSGSSSSHLLGEALAAGLSITVGAALWFTAKSTSQSWLKILAIGFFAAAGLDFAHGIATEIWGDDYQISNLTLLMSRLTLVASSILAIRTLNKDSSKSLLQRIDASIPSALAVTLLVAAAIAVAVSVNGFADRGTVLLSFSASGAGFITALLILRNRQNPLAYFQSFLIASLFINAAADGAFMAYSTGSFDDRFAIFHLLRLISYAAVLGGSVVESVRLYGHERVATANLSEINEAITADIAELSGLTQDLQALNQIGRIAGESGSVSDRFDEIGNVIADRISADRILVASIGSRVGVAVIEAVYGQTMPARGPGDEVPLRGTVTGDVVKEKKTLTFNEAEIREMAARYSRNTADLQAEFKSWMSTQILVDDKVVGSLMARSKSVDAYGPREIQFFEQVASQLAGPILQSQLANSKNLFYSSISHELKTPIAAVRGYVGLLKMTGGKNLTEEQLEFIESIHRNNEQLLMLIDDLMDVGTISDQKMRVNLEPVELDSVMSECIDDLEILAKAKDQSIRTEFESQDFTVKADRRRLIQIITNIGSNASKYSPERSTITIKVRANGDSLEIAVADQGIGISEEDQQKLFTPFFRSSNSTALQEKGTGLGLVICKSIAESHGGSISVRSQLGEGSTVTISMPLENSGRLNAPDKAAA